MSRRKFPILIVLPQSGSLEPYELVDVKLYEPSPSPNFLLDCPSCKVAMRPVVDIQQMGFWEDHYETYFACTKCHLALLFDYRLSRIEPAPKPGKKKAAR